MKSLLLALTFLFSIDASAYCNHLVDGSCFNDDYMGDEKSEKSIVKYAEPPHPDLLPRPPRHPLKFLKKKKRKPASAFVPVQTGKSVSGFVEVGKPLSPSVDKSNDPTDSRGSH